MAIAKKLASARNQLAKSLNEIPIRWGKYINHDMEEQKVIFVGHEKAIYDSNGKKLSEKLADLEENLSDAFSETKSYAVGDYCIYLNRLYRFTASKEPGPWDGTKVTPSILSRELQRVEGEVAGLSSDLNGIMLTQNANLNEISIPGNYWAAGANSILNKPIGVNAFGLKVYKVSGNYIGQCLTESSAGRVFYRLYNIISWSAWEEVALKSNFHPINISNQSLKTVRRSGWYMGNQITELINNGISGLVWFNIFATYQDDGLYSFIFLGMDGSRYTGVITRGSSSLEYFKSF